MQGDVVAVPRSIVIDFSTFQRDILPVLQEWATHGGISPVFDPGSTDLPPVSLESHVTVDHAAYPPNPSRATAWSGQLRSLLERRAAGSILVADNAAETLVLARIRRHEREDPLPPAGDPRRPRGRRARSRRRFRPRRGQPA